MKQIGDSVSIIVPVYNAERYIKETIQTVLDQTYTNWELILIDDKSTDDSMKLIAPYLKKDKRIKLLKNKTNLHAALTRNKGIRAATGRFIAFLDADDLWMPLKLEKQVNFMLKNNYDFSFTGYEFANSAGESTGKNVRVPESIAYKQALKNTTIFTSTVMFNMTKLTKQEIQMPNIPRGQDTATWWKVLKKVDYAFGLDEILSTYRRTNSSLSANKITAIKRTWNLYRDAENLSIFHSSVNFMSYSYNAIKRRSTRNDHYKITMFGHYGYGTDAYEGQTVKTRAVHDALVDKYGSKQVQMFDTYGWKKHPISLLRQTLKAARKSDNVIILPSHGGFKIFILIFFTLSKVYNFKSHYIVIGGWLYTLIKNKPLTSWMLKSYDGIYVETGMMSVDLKKHLKSDNIYVVPNFKNINVLKSFELVITSDPPYRICTFSRVMEEKGIEDAINVVRYINHKMGKTLYTLDIYGAINDDYSVKFAELRKDFPDYIQYKGAVDPNNSVGILKNYYFLLFPTHYKTEGIPGTIIDAYASGIPVIASIWDNFSEVIKGGSTGFGYKMGDSEQLKEVLIKCLDPDVIRNMKMQCILEASKYGANYALSSLYMNMETV